MSGNGPRGIGSGNSNRRRRTGGDGHRGRGDGHRGRGDGYRGRGDGYRGTVEGDVSLSDIHTIYYKIRYYKEYEKKGDHTAYKPKMLGSFSLSEEHEFSEFDEARFSTIRDPADVKLPINLDIGYQPDIEIGSKTISEFPEAEGVREKPLRWLIHSGNVPDVQVITMKGVLKQIAHTIAKKHRNAWDAIVCKFRGKLYLKWPEEDDREESEYGRRNSYWGVQFEKHVMDNPEKGTFKILRGMVGKKAILISGEIDAVTPDGKSVEVKTCFPDKLRDKMSLTWIQSYLSGIDTLYYGWKDRDPVTKKGNGIVSRPPEFIPMDTVLGSKQDIGNLLDKSKPPYLERNTADGMFGFLEDVLDWLFEKLPDENIVWKLDFSEKGQVIILERSSGKFLPDLYVEFLNSFNTGTSSHLSKSNDMDEMGKQFASLGLSH